MNNKSKPLIFGGFTFPDSFSYSRRIRTFPEKQNRKSARLFLYLIKRIRKESKIWADTAK